MAKITFIKPSAIKDGSIELAKLSEAAKAAFAAADHKHDLKDLDDSSKIIEGINGRISGLDEAINGKGEGDAHVDGLADRVEAIEGKLGADGSVSSQIAAVKSAILGKDGDADFNGTVKGAYDAAAEAKSAADDALEVIGDSTKGLVKADADMAAKIAALEALHANATEGTGKMTVAAEAEAAAAAEVAKVVANADENFDTLKEIADWILNDKTGAAALQNDVASLKTAVGAPASGEGDGAVAASGLFKRIADLEAADASGITAAKIEAWDAVAAKKSDYDAHLADTDIHVTTEDKTKWNAKQDALSEEQLAAIDAVADKAEASTVEALEKYVKGDDKDGNGGLVKRIADLEAADVQEALTEDQLAAVNSGITSEKVGDYDEHIADTVKHITADERTAWNAYATSKADADHNHDDDYYKKVAILDLNTSRIAVKVGDKYYDLAGIMARVLEITDLADGEGLVEHTADDVVTIA